MLQFTCNLLYLKHFTFFAFAYLSYALISLASPPPVLYGLQTSSYT